MEPNPSLIRPVKEYTIGWICALALEQTASGSVLDSIHSYKGHPDVPPEDDDIHVLGNIGSHNIVIATLPKGIYGNTKAAGVVSRLKGHFRAIKFLFMVGIGGGIPNLEGGADIRLGDVVVSVPEGKYSGVVRWDFGKTEKGRRFNRTGCLNRPPEKLLHAINNLQFQHNLFGSQISNYVAEVHQRYPNLRAFSYLGPENDNLYRADYEHEDEHSLTCEACDSTKVVNRRPRSHKDPVVHYGIIASGDQVIKDASLRDELRRDLKAKCVEMEGGGVMDNVQCLVVRGICDYCDSHKNKDWQPYAALTAASYTKELLKVLLTQGGDSPQLAQEARSPGGQPSLVAPQAPEQPIPTNQSPLLGGINNKGGAAGNNYHRLRPRNLPQPGPASGGGPSAGPSGVWTPLRPLVVAPPPPAPLPPQLQRYSIAAVNWGSWNYRLYFQTSRGIFEAKRDAEDWEITEIPGINAAQYTPLAAISRRNGRDIRLYYLTPDCMLQEHRFTTVKGAWAAGNLHGLQVKATPSSRIAAVEWSGHIRVYYQGYNYDKIEELCFMDSVRNRGAGNIGGWERGASLRTASNGTSIAAASYISDSIKIHIFYQDEKCNVRELIYNGSKWEEGPFVPSALPEYTSITTCALFANSSQIVVFGKSKDGTVSEFSGDEMGNWTKQGVDKDSFIGSNPTLAVTMSGTSRRNLFVHRGEGDIFEECWASGIDGGDWFVTRKVDSKY
ncbi:hypothetical protein TWF281_010492 [Arthrobotrys megalospora]